MLVDCFCVKQVFYNEEEKRKIFPTSKLLENNWKVIRNECLGAIGNIQNMDNVGKKFIIEDNLFWEGWKTYLLRMFNRDHTENMAKCPELSKILKADSNITSAFFSIMEPGKKLSSHNGPFKGILRYHLALLVPPKESGNCFISVDNNVYEWVEGEGVLFDETYKHFVENETDYCRIILFIDVKRPFENHLLSLTNDFILYIISISPYNFH